MKRQYTKPSCQFVEIKLSGSILADSNKELPTQPGVIENPDDVMSKSYQGGANSLLWEED